MSRYILTLVAITQCLVGAGWYLTQRGVAASNTLLPAEQPIDFASVVWGVIFLLYLAFAIIALKQREERWTDRIAGPLILTGVLTVIWMQIAQFAALPALDLTLLALAGSTAWWSAYRLDLIGRLGGSPLKSLAGAVTGLFSGWLTVKAALAIPLTIRAHTDLGLTDYPWLLLWSVLAPLLVLTWLFTRYISRNIWYYAALIWGLGAIVLNNWTITGTHWLGTVTAIIACLILYLRLTRGADGATAET